MPELIAELVLPKATVDYPGIPSGTVAADINAATDNVGKLDVNIDNVCLKFGGIDLDVSGTVSDLAGDDPLMDIEGIAYACSMR